MKQTNQMTAQDLKVIDTTYSDAHSGVRENGGSYSGDDLYAAFSYNDMTYHVNFDLVVEGYVESYPDTIDTPGLDESFVKSVKVYIKSIQLDEDDILLDDQINELFVNAINKTL